MLLWVSKADILFLIDIRLQWHSHTQQAPEEHSHIQYYSIFLKMWSEATFELSIRKDVP